MKICHLMTKILISIFQSEEWKIWRGKRNSLKEFRMLALGGAPCIIILQKIKYNTLNHISIFIRNQLAYRYLLKNPIFSIFH
jgi:hypothetical protein